ncbi:hypothetical protein [Lysobacter sp. A3-1-A15]|uniref:hypothetical protein n=1 Tax=Novilysobacter viscosus TaxID=3098602 RepID=UPI002ED91B23
MSRITLRQLRDYLIAQAWSLIAAPNGFVEVWRYASQEGGEVLLPTEQASDKEFLLHEALRKLAASKGATASELTQDIRDTTENAVSIRVSHPDVKDGSIPLEDGIALNKNARELLSAAASAALEKRPLYLGRPAAAVAALLQSARLGQTTHGSYVIHVYCKESTREDQPRGFARIATQTLGSALLGLNEAIQHYSEAGNPIAFELAFARGASANLCEAVAQFSGKDRSRTVEISLSTDSVDQLTKSPRTSVTFTPDQQPYLQAAADYFRQTYTLTDVTVVGVVERLTRRAEQEAGLIHLATTLTNGAQRSVGIPLGTEDYATAIHAHENKQLVQVSGSVIVTPRTASMVEPKDFRVLGNYELFRTQ